MRSSFSVTSTPSTVPTSVRNAAQPGACSSCSTNQRKNSRWMRTERETVSATCCSVPVPQPGGGSAGARSVSTGRVGPWRRHAFS